MDCAELGSEIKTLGLTDGHWRANEDTTDVQACPVPAACVGGNTTEDGSCLDGNGGVLCAICEEGYYRPSAYATCEVCGSKGQAIAAAAGILALMAVALGIFVLINRKAPNGLLRPFIDLVQKVTVMLKYDAPFPDALVEAGKVLAGLSLGLEIVSPQCAGLGSSYYSMLAYEVAMLVLLCFVMLVPMFAYAKFRRGWSLAQTMQSSETAGRFRDLFVVILLVYPSLSGKAMEFFRCRKVEGVYYLMADYSLVCYDSKWFTFLPLVVGVLVCFSFGMPALIAYTLRKRIGTLYDEHGKAKPQPLDILYAIYQPHAYYYESVQMVFKLALWGTLVFFEHGSEMQLATALVVNVLQLCIHIEIKPMGGEDAGLLNTMQAASLVLTT